MTSLGKDSPATTPPAPQARRRRWSTLLLGAAAIGALALALFRALPAPRTHLTLTAGPVDSTRAIVAGKLIEVLADRGIDVRLVERETTADELDAVNAGDVDLALVSEAYRIHKRPHLREVGPLYLEALHLLVRSDLVGSIEPSLGGLRGHSVDLGPRGSATHGLAAAVLTFAGLPPGAAASRLQQINLNHLDLEARIASGDPRQLPDAIFDLATVPSKMALSLVRDAGYTLVALPFGNAFRLGAILRNQPDSGIAPSIDPQDVHDDVIPAFTYHTEPAVPEEDLHTLGTRLMIVTHREVPAAVIQTVLDAIFNSSFTRFTQPPLKRSILSLPPQIAQHVGTLEYLAHDQPFMTNDNVDELSNTLSIIGALVGGGIFVWQWWRQRRQNRQEAVFSDYLRQIAALEQRVAELELSAQLELEPLVEVQKQLLRLKSEALDRFTAGELGGQSALSDLLDPVNSARDHIGDLILHVRDNLEEQADAEGRSSRAVWAEAMSARKDPTDRGSEM